MAAAPALAVLAVPHPAPADPPVRRGEGRARVRARCDLPARPAEVSAKGPWPVPAHPGRGQDGQGRPPHGHAERAAAGGHHQGQLPRTCERVADFRIIDPEESRSCRSRTSWPPPRRSRRPRCGRCSASTCSTSSSPSARRSTKILQKIIDEATAPGVSRSRSWRSRTSRSRPAMQRAMARQAEAERERRAKVIAAEGEFQALASGCARRPR